MTETRECNACGAREQYENWVMGNGNATYWECWLAAQRAAPLPDVVGAGAMGDKWWRDYIDLAWRKAEEYSGGDPEKFIRFLAGALPAKTTSEDMEWAAEVAKQLGVGTPTDALPPQVRGDGEETK